jgi:hypothetical protein
LTARPIAADGSVIARVKSDEQTYAVPSAVRTGKVESRAARLGNRDGSVYVFQIAKQLD